MDKSIARKWRKDYQPPAFTLTEVDLLFDIYPNYVEVYSSLQLQRQRQDCQACVLNGDQLQLQWLEIEGRRLQAEEYEYDQQAALLTIHQPPEHFSLRSCVRIDPYHNKALSGFYQSGEILCSQNEAEGFRRITFFLDRPDVMSRFQCEIRADQQRYPVLLSNGNLLQSGPLAHGRHYVKWQDPFPKPCYLFALVAGKLEHLSDDFISRSGRRIQLKIYTEAGKVHLTHFAMDALKRSMAWDEKNFGREYDLDLFMIVAVDSFNFGAMENKGLNIFNSRLIYADPQIATDDDFADVEGVVAHEYFHNWTGNRITCRDWFQLTLKEGLTVYRDEEFSADQTNRTVKRVNDVNFLRQRQYPEDAGPNRHPIRPDSYIQIENFYTDTIYAKGAAVIRMIAEYVGKELFRKGMDCYFARFDGMAVSCDDFIDAIEAGSGFDLSSLRRWYSQPGTPRVKVSLDMQPGSALVQLEQSNPLADEQAAPLGIPFPINLYNRSGELIAQQRPLLQQSDMQIRFEGIQERPVLSLLPNHGAPVIVDYSYCDEELLLLLAHDQDPFNRREAGQRLYSRTILRLCTQADFLPPPELGQTLARLINDESLDPDYRALLLCLPSVQELSDSQEFPQFQLLWQQRNYLGQILAQQLAPTCLRQFHATRSSDPSYSPRLAARRRLRASMASLLALGGERQLIIDYYQQAVNMSEALHGLQLLCQHFPGQETHALLLQFRQKWQSEFLVLCKWFALQAMVVQPQTVEQVATLATDPLFRGEMPNMVRALYRTLTHNLPIFHGADGAAYQLLANEILRTDAFNPTLASGLATRFIAYARLPQPQKELVHSQLLRILAHPGLSACTYEPIAAIVAEESAREH